MTVNREARRLKKKEKKVFFSPKRLFRKIRRDDKDLKGIHKDEEETEKEEQLAERAFDAKQTTKTIEKRIDELVKDQKLLTEMTSLANLEEYHELKNMDELAERTIKITKNLEIVAEKLATNHMQNATDYSQEFQKDISELQQLFNKVRTDVLDKAKTIINTERKRARDLFRENEKLRDRSYKSFYLLYRKIKKTSKDGLKEVKHVNKLEHHIKKLGGEIRSFNGKIDKMGDKIDVKTAVKNLESYIKEAKEDLKDIDKAIIDEITDLAHIEQFLIILEFRDNPNDLLAVIERVKKRDFPQDKLEEIERDFNEAYHKIEEFHRKARMESRALYRQT